VDALPINNIVNILSSPLSGAAVAKGAQFVCLRANELFDFV